MSSLTVVHRASDPAFRAEPPYAIATVEFEEGGRLIGNVTGRPVDAVRVGMPVYAVFETVDERIGVPKFQPLV